MSTITTRRTAMEQFRIEPELRALVKLAALAEGRSVADWWRTVGRRAAQETLEEAERRAQAKHNPFAPNFTGASSFAPAEAPIVSDSPPALPSRGAVVGAEGHHFAQESCSFACALAPDNTSSSDEPVSVPATSTSLLEAGEGLA